MNIKFRNILLRQYNIGNWWGGFKQVASSATMYITIINLGLLAVTAYGTTIAPWLQDKGLNIPFVVFMGVIFICIVLILILEYKLTMPSSFSFWNEQWWKHDNPIKVKMDNLDKRMETMEKILERIEAKSKC